MENIATWIWYDEEEDDNHEDLLKYYKKNQYRGV